MSHIFEAIASCFRPTMSPKTRKEQDAIDDATTLMMIQRYKLWYLIVDRRTGYAIANCSLAEYDNNHHELLVDAPQFMKYMKRST